MTRTVGNAVARMAAAGDDPRAGVRLAIGDVEAIIKDIEAGGGNTEAAAKPFREALAAMRGEKAPQ